MVQSNEDLIRSLYEARERDDLEAVRFMLADGIVWREPDLDNPHTGNLRGPEAVLGMIREAQRITGGTFRLVPSEIVAHGGQVVAFIDWSAERDGARIEGKEIAVYPCAGRQDSGGFFPRR
ncbi:MAG: nuclear transport factor 2 family protein [Rubrobacteraceae bacterium]